MRKLEQALKQECLQQERNATKQEQRLKALLRRLKALLAGALWQ
jgi:hypothetical protein